MQRPCTERHRKALAWGCTGDMEEKMALTPRKVAAHSRGWGPLLGAMGLGGNPAFSSQVPKHLQGGNGDEGTGMFYLQDRGQEDRNPRQHKDNDASHSLLPGMAREAG